MILSQLIAALLHFLARVADCLEVISYDRLVVSTAMVERTIFSHVNYLRATLVLASGATVIMGMALVLMGMAMVVAAVVAMIMGIAAMRRRTMGMRTPATMFVVTVMMPALTVTVFVIIVIGLGCRHWTGEDQRAGEQSS